METGHLEKADEILAEGKADCSSSRPNGSKALGVGPGDQHKVSSRDDSVGVLINGNGIVVTVTKRVVETEVDPGIRRENKEEQESNDGLENETGKGQGLDSVDAVNRREENGFKENGTGKYGKKSGMHNPDRRLDFISSDVSVAAEVLGSLASDNGSQIKVGFKDDKGTSAERDGDPGYKLAKVADSLLEDKCSNQNESVDKQSIGNFDGQEVGFLEEENGEEQSKNSGGKGASSLTEGNDHGQNGSSDGKESISLTLGNGGNQKAYGVEERIDDSDVEELGEHDHDYAVGDFVWGKIRSHPWWPGLIYDPSDASDFAIKVKQKGRLLIGYFGDGSFSWCHPTQLKPFVKNFEEITNQSSSKNFINAVLKALDEIGRLVEVEMTCKCVNLDNHILEAKPENGGIRAGVLAPKSNPIKLLVAQLQPQEVLSNLQNVAKEVSLTSMLELVIQRSFLVAYYHSKGNYRLPIFHEPATVEGLEDKSESQEVGADGSNEPAKILTQGPPEDDWHSSPPLLQECSEVGGDQVYQRRKEKSMAELMEEELDTDSKGKKATTAKEKTLPGMAASGRKGRQAIIKSEKSSNEKGEANFKNLVDLSVDNAISVEKKGRKMKVDMSVEPKTDKADKTAASTAKMNRKKKDEISGAPERAEISPSTEKKEGMKRKAKSTEVSESIKNDVFDEGEGKTPELSLSKEERGNLLSSTQNDGKNAESEANKSFAARERKKSKYLSPLYTTPKFSGDSKSESGKIVNSVQIGEKMTKLAGRLIVSPQVLSPCGEQSRENLLEGPSSKTPGHDLDSGIDYVKTLDATLDVNQVLSRILSAAANPFNLMEKKDDFMGFLIALRSALFKNGSNYKDFQKSNPSRKRKKSSYWADTEASAEVTSKNKNPMSLIITFPPAFRLPTKGEIIEVFSQFGEVNERETDVLYNSYCARVVFVESSNADKAFYLSMEKSPYPNVNVNFRLRPYETIHRKTSANAGLGVGYFKRRLEMARSIVENETVELTAEMKSNLRGALMEILEKLG